MAISRFVNFSIIFASTWGCVLACASVYAEIVVDSQNSNNISCNVTGMHCKNAMPAIVMDYPVIENNVDYHIYRSKQWAKSDKNSNARNQGVHIYADGYDMTPAKKNALRAKSYVNKQ